MNLLKIKKNVRLNLTLIFLFINSLNGYSLNYNMSNSTNTIDCSISNTFFDSGGAGSNYGNNENITMTFVPNNPGEFIVLTFNIFNIQGNTDYISFYNGTSTADTLIATYTSNTSIGTIGATNSSGAITIVFTSNASNSKLGWEAAITCSSIPVYSTVSFMTDGAFFRTCGGTFYDQGGSGDDYLSNQIQTMTFLPAISGNYIELIFSEFNLLELDFITFYNGTSITDSLIGTYTSDALIGTIGATNTDGAITIVFKTNSSSTSDGWRAVINCSSTPVYSTVSYMTDGAFFRTCGGVFYDQGGNDDYLNSQIQTMTILPAISGNYIELTFSELLVQANVDFISFHDGMSVTDSLIGIYTSNTLIDTIGATNSEGAITIVFKSNISNTMDGWKASINCKQKEISTSTAIMTDGAYLKTCGGTFYDQGGIDSDYLNNQNQTMTIVPLFSGNISIIFTDFNLRNSDFLSIYNGPSSSSALLGSFTGGSLPGTFTSTSPNGELTFIFISNSSSTNDGWIADIADLNCIDNSLQVKINNFTAAATKNKYVELKWETIYKSNSDFFTIERSNNSIDWEEIEKVEAIKNTYSIVNYQSKDDSPSFGISYYRIKQYDYNGISTYSKVKRVNIKDDLTFLTYPNPSNGILQLKLSSSLLQEPIVIEIYDILGNRVYRKSTTKRINKKNYLIEAPHLSKGIYQLIVKSERSIEMEKITIQ